MFFARWAALFTVTIVLVAQMTHNTDAVAIFLEPL